MLTTVAWTTLLVLNYLVHWVCPNINGWGRREPVLQFLVLYCSFLYSHCSLYCSEGVKTVVWRYTIGELEGSEWWLGAELDETMRGWLNTQKKDVAWGAKHNGMNIWPVGGEVMAETNGEVMLLCIFQFLIKTTTPRIWLGVGGVGGGIQMGGSPWYI